jgi:hypothetical protein
VNPKDSPEVSEFLRLFARLKDWSDDDPTCMPELAHADEGLRDLGLKLLKAAGSIQKSERSHRDLFTGPTDPKFIVEWRDFEERFANVLLKVSSEAGDQSFLFSFDYYEEPEQWEVADFHAITYAESFKAAFRFAREKATEADTSGLSWTFINPKAASGDFLRAYENLAKARSAWEDEREELIEEYQSSVLTEINQCRDEALKSKLRDMLFEIERDEFDDWTPMEVQQAAKDAWFEWENLKHTHGLDLRGIIRRRKLIPFVLFPRHVSARQNNTDLPSIYHTLRQAHEAFIFGVPFASLALMRSVLEMVIRDHYGAKGSDLSELINSIAQHLPRRANAARLHGLRKLANEILHANSEKKRGHPRKETKVFEQEMVSLFFVLRALVEAAPR